MIDLPRVLARKGIYYGWVIVGVVFLISFSRVGFTGFFFGLFLKPMSEDFGWTRATTTGAVTLGSLVAGLVAYFFGRVLDRYGPRAMMALATAAMGACYFAMAGVGGLFLYYLIYPLGRTVNQSALGEPMIAAAVAKWFVRLRGTAIGIASIGGPISGAVMAIPIQQVITTQGWRMGWLALGVLTWLLIVPPAILLLRRSPEALGLQPDGDRGEVAPRAPRTSLRRRAGGREYSFPMAEALRTPSFWLLCLVTGLGSLSGTGVGFHMVPFLTDVGISPTIAASALSLYTVAWAVALLVLSHLADRVSARTLTLVIIAWLVLGIFMLIITRTPTMAFVTAPVYGFGTGGFQALLQLVWADYFGRRYLGSIRGVSMFFQMGGNASGVLISALIFDLTGSYLSGFWAFLVVKALVFFMMVAALPPRAREEPQPLS